MESGSRGNCDYGSKEYWNDLYLNHRLVSHPTPSKAVQTSQDRIINNNTDGDGDERIVDRGGEVYDWYCSYALLKPIFDGLFGTPTKVSSTMDAHELKAIRILNVGCGNSMLSEEMYDDGFRNIVSIDFSSNVIETMEKRNKLLKREEMQWMTLDASKLTTRLSKGCQTTLVMRQNRMMTMMMIEQLYVRPERLTLCFCSSFVV
eukprot:TRINITY_DN14586_c0_g1_i1.p1 TRINITY_DN14586_c0_g1~~TRINITY_DN14586_c0_g1_i1.p1  ORF type:complete len:204 (-),score=39.15 TRINITY_DN14586_c0_g1_i1:585-1196(-)